MPKYDPQHYLGVCASTDNAVMPPTPQQANGLSPPLSLRSTTPEAEEVRSEVARFDAVLEKIQEQRMLAEELAARQAVTRKQQKKVSKKAEVAKAETDRLQMRTRTSTTNSQKYTQVSLCTHRVYWTPVAGRSRCGYHSYSPGGYRNPFRFQCPGCNTVACGHCLKKLRRGDALF
jgi:hypothetical protein